MDNSNKSGEVTCSEVSILSQEYFFLQTLIEDYNKQIWVIKALGITGTGAAIGLTLQQEKPMIALAACAIPIFFWILESQWKHFQRGFYPRVVELEAILRDNHCLRGPAIFSSWSKALKRGRVPSFNRQGYLWDGLLNPSVFISYILEIIFLVIVSFMQIS